MNKNPFYRKNLNSFLTATLCLAAVLYPDVIFALDLTGVSGTMSNNTKSGASLVKIIAGTAGFGLTLSGINGIVQANKREEGLGGPLTKTGVGAALFSGSVFASTASNSVFGTDAGTNLLGI